MLNIPAMTKSSKQIHLDQEILKAFEAQLRGELLQPGDDGYDEARTIWNGMIDKRPALIARCTGVADVTQAVNFAVKTDSWSLSVAGGIM